jgi:hypothetical protein
MNQSGGEARANKSALEIKGIDKVHDASPKMQN